VTDWVDILEDDISPLRVMEFGLNREFELWQEADWILPVLDLGPGRKLIRGAVRLDLPDWDAETMPLPYEEGSVGGIFAMHFLEHLSDPRPLIGEAARVLALGCPFTIVVPHGRSKMYLQDCDHKTPFVLDSWDNILNNKYYSKGRQVFSDYLMRVGFSMVYAVKEGNEAIITQLIRED